LTGGDSGPLAVAIIEANRHDTKLLTVRIEAVTVKRYANAHIKL
jgi:hypothetical protein